MADSEAAAPTSEATSDDAPPEDLAPEASSSAAAAEETGVEKIELPAETAGEACEEGDEACAYASTMDEGWSAMHDEMDTLAADDFYARVEAAAELGGGSATSDQSSAAAEETGVPEPDGVSEERREAASATESQNVEQTSQDVRTPVNENENADAARTRETRTARDREGVAEQMARGLAEAAAAEAEWEARDGGRRRSRR